MLWAFRGGLVEENPPASAADSGSIPKRGRSPGGGMATHFGVPAWKSPRTEEPGGLQSMGSPKSGV